MARRAPQRPAVFMPSGAPPQAVNPAAASYAAGIEARRKSAKLPKVTADEPVGGPPVAIPRLDSFDSSMSGLTMHQVAMAQKQAEQGGAGHIVRPAPSIVEPVTVGTPASMMAIRPGDMLPPEAQQDPQFIHGHGAMYASNQPAMAMKYGVIRNGQRVAAQELRNPVRRENVIRPETRAGVQQLTEAMAAATPAASVAPDLEKLGQEAPGREAAENAASIGSLADERSPEPVSEEEREKVKRIVAEMDEFDFNAFREITLKDILNNSEQRDIIEKRLKPLDIGDLIINGFVEQAVPILPDKFFPTFRSMTGEEDLVLKRLIMEESRSVTGIDRYLLDKHAFMTTVLGVVKINGNPLPSHQNERGEFDEKKFWTKFNKMVKLPFHMLTSLGVNYYWFDLRVRRLFRAETLGNG